MQTVRLYNCARCHVQVMICSQCDHGHIYCHHGCAKTARTASRREAGRRYQAKPQGRFKHAARQARYRRHRIQNQKVTHQGSLALSAHDSLASEPNRYVDETVYATLLNDDTLRCHFCGQPCSPFVRNSFFLSRQRPAELKRSDRLTSRRSRPWGRQ